MVLMCASNDAHVQPAPAPWSDSIAVITPANSAVLVTAFCRAALHVVPVPTFAAQTCSQLSKIVCPAYHRTSVSVVLAHSITETCVEAASFQSSVLPNWVPAGVHVGVLLAAEGPVPTPATPHVAAVRPVIPPADV